MINIIIHIGPPKTGTSAIQKWLKDHTDDLKQCGVYYPEHLEDSNGVSSGNLLSIFERTIKLLIAKKQEGKDYAYVANAQATIKGITADIDLLFNVIDSEKPEVVGIAKVEREKFTIGTNKKAKNISKMVELRYRVFLNDDR